MGRQRDSSYYDRVFTSTKKYHLSFEEMIARKIEWAIVWEQSIPLLKKYNIESILDIGSGMGQFGQGVQKFDIKYKGIDFSQQAIQHSIRNRKGSEVFECVNALEYSFDDEVDCYTSYEFLEHINQDIEVLSKLKPNKLIIFSVPSHNSAGHARTFKNEDDIILRYSPYIEGLEIKRVTNYIHFLAWGITL